MTCRRLLGTLGVLLVLAPGAAARPLDETPRDLLRALLARWDAAPDLVGPTFQIEEEARVEVALSSLSAALSVGVAGVSFEVDGVLLLDAASFGVHRMTRPEDRGTSTAVERLRRGSHRALTGLATSPRAEEVGAWLGQVVADRAAPPGRRGQALELVDAHRPEPARVALLAVARDEADPLRPSILGVLATWPDEAVDLFLVNLVARRFDEEGGAHPWTILLQRVREVEEPLGLRATEALRPRLAALLLSSDWREAARAIEVTRGLRPEFGVPLLLDALSAWTRREEAGGGSKRILDDVLRELRRRSGRSIGRNPRNWITWWIAVRQGKAALADADGSSPEAQTQAMFFGLRPMTDQVTFVIDISGSMSTGWGTTGHTRYVEAVEQMMQFLQAGGEQTRFNVILFSDEPLRSSKELVPATTRNLARARRSLLDREPGGGTHLRPAIDLALRLDRDGRLDLSKLEADTIIVLCDGETAEGRGWVKPLLASLAAESQVRIHCVLLGTRGDGTLEALAEGTGGDFVRIGG